MLRRANILRREGGATRESSRGVPRAAAMLACAGWMALSAGCVVEESSRGRSRVSSGSAASLPEGPIARPAKGVTSNSRVTVAIAPLGVVSYDGLTLPMVSPDGRFVVVQDGEAPTWATILAGPGSEVPVSTRLAVYDATGSPMKRIEPASELPEGLVLGRSCDHRGFLVESPRADGSRWIGRVAWMSGEVEWLVRDGNVNAHAVLLGDGSLAFTRRSAAAAGDAAASELVVRTRSGAESVKRDERGPYAMPIASEGGAFVGVLAVTPAGIEFQAISLKGGGGIGSVVARRLVSSATDIATAYQIVASIQGAMPVARGGDGGDVARKPVASGSEDAAKDEVAGARSVAAIPAVNPDRIALFSPLIGRMAVIDVRTSAMTGLSANSIAAIPWTSASAEGYLCTTPTGLVFSRSADGAVGRLGEAESRPDARVLGESFIARRTLDPMRPAVLFGPVRGDPRSMQVVALLPAE